MAQLGVTNVRQVVMRQDTIKPGKYPFDPQKSDYRRLVRAARSDDRRWEAAMSGEAGTTEEAAFFIDS